MSRRWWAVAVGGVALLATAGCGGRGVEPAARASTAKKAVPVTVVPVGRRSVERTVDVVGTLKGLEEVTVGTKRTGRVVRVLHDMGDHVRPGEPLVELDALDARLTLDQAKSRYMADLVKLGITRQQAESAWKRFGISEELLNGEEATRLIEQSPAIVQASVAVEKATNNLDRQRQLHRRGAGALEELQNAETDFKSAKAAKDNAVSTARNVIAMSVSSKVAIDLAEQALKEMTVSAPTPSKLPDGLDRSKVTYAITKRSVSEGQFLREGDAVADLVIENPLRLWANVPERSAAVVKLGQPVRVSVAAYPSEPFEGTVTRLNPTVDPASRTFQVEIAVPNDGGKLRPGGFAKAAILTDRHARALVVPREAVLQFAGVTKLFLRDGDTARSVLVDTGVEDRDWVEVVPLKDPLPDGAEVVTDGNTQLADGTAIVVKGKPTTDDTDEHR